MARTKLINGEPIPAHTGNLNVLSLARELEQPVIPVKSEKELLMEAELDRLRAENNALKSKPANGLSLKVSEKGALSVYGMGRFPVTLYREQWERLFAATDQIKAFIVANNLRLKLKE